MAQRAKILGNFVAIICLKPATLRPSFHTFEDEILSTQSVRVFFVVVVCFSGGNTREKASSI